MIKEKQLCMPEYYQILYLNYKLLSCVVLYINYCH